jgi:hypothetical protein
MKRDTSDIVGDLTYAIEDFAEEHELGEGREYLCVVPHGWARSADPVVAFAKAMRNGAYFGDGARARFWECDSGTCLDEMGGITYLDEMGGIYWKRDKGAPSEVELSIDVGPEVRDAWRYYVDALPRVAYLALHKD